MVRGWAGFVASLLLTLALAGCLGTRAPAAPSGLDPGIAGSQATPQVVIAHIDTGINPYHKTFRSVDPKAWMHPSTYIRGYPTDAEALTLTLDARDYAKAVKKDEDVWKSVKQGTLYWVPGTRIVGAISFGPGGVYCPPVSVPPANQLSPLQGDCQEHGILDDFGHGTMTASRMAGGSHSLAPQALIVSIEGGERKALQFIAKAGWIDVVSNSWGSLLPTAADAELARAVEDAADHALFLFASGNGLGFLNGGVGQPTQYMPTGAANVLLVGAHDNGYVTLWHGAPVHVVADGYGGWRASSRSLEEFSPSSEACCTSAAAPYAAGGAAALILDARTILEDSLTGLRGTGDEGVLAEGRPGFTLGGPLTDGKFTLRELKEVFQRTAQARPLVTPRSADDGLINWAATASPPRDPWPGDNPYCVACFTTTVTLASINRDVPLTYLIGYGAINLQGVETGKYVLRGDYPMPTRNFEDRFFDLDHQVRELVAP